MGEFVRGLRVQCRVIGSIMMREIYSRYGRENLGFAWVFAEPLCFVFPVLTMWHFIRPKYSMDGLTWADISWSGYLPLMMYRHLGGSALYILRWSSSLFYHRLVSTYDIVFARIAVEALSNITAALFSLGVLMSVGEVAAPENWPMLFVGYFYMAWWCIVVALLVGGLCEHSVWVEKIWIPLGYMYIAVSGCFFLAHWLPPSVRKIALLQPSMQAYEMIRCGMFGTRVPTYFDFTYATLSLAVLTLIGLAAVRSARRHVVLV